MEDTAPTATPPDKDATSCVKLRGLKKKYNIRWSSGAIRGLDRKIERLIADAIERAEKNGRKTLKEQDF